MAALFDMSDVVSTSANSEWYLMVLSVHSHSSRHSQCSHVARAVAQPNFTSSSDCQPGYPVDVHHMAYLHPDNAILETLDCTEKIA